MGHPRTALTSTDIDRLAWDRASGGLLPAIVQDAATLQVLVLAWMNPESLAETLDSGEVTFWSRSRQARWRKGDTSGNRLRVVEVLADCDADSLLVTAEPLGPACHEGLTSCFGDQDAPGLGRFARLEHTIAGRQTAAHFVKTGARVARADGQGFGPYVSGGFVPEQQVLAGLLFRVEGEQG